jgi:hypothetical protein
MKNTIAVCETVEDVYKATDQLDKATSVLLKIDDGGVIKDVKKFKGIYNVSKGEMACAVIPHYNLVQHKQYFDSFATALGRLNIDFSMTLKYSGNRAFADVEFKDRNLKFDKLDEEFTTGLRLANSYDKTCGLLVAPRYTRLACVNGMILTRSERTLSIKHHTKIVKEIEVFVEKKLNEFISSHTDLQQWVSTSMDDSIEWRTTCAIIEKLFSQIKHREEILRNLGISIVIVTDKKTKKKSISYVPDDNKIKENPITRWEMYNAVTKYLTHGEQITPHIESLFHKQAEKLLVTPIEKLPRVKVVLQT